MTANVQGAVQADGILAFASLCNGRIDARGAPRTDQNTVQASHIGPSTRTRFWLLLLVAAAGEADLQNLPVVADKPSRPGVGEGDRPVAADMGYWQPGSALVGRPGG